MRRSRWLAAAAFVVVFGADSAALAEEKRLTVALSWKNLPRSEGQEVYTMGTPIDPDYSGTMVRYVRSRLIETFSIVAGKLVCTASVDRGVTLVMQCSDNFDVGWLSLSRLADSENRGIQLEVVWQETEGTEEPSKPPPKGRKKIPVPLPKGSTQSMF